MEISQAYTIRSLITSAFEDGCTPHVAQQLLERYGSMPSIEEKNTLADENIREEVGYDIANFVLPKRYDSGIIVIEPLWTHGDPPNSLLVAYTVSTKALLGYGVFPCEQIGVISATPEAILIDSPKDTLLSILSALLFNPLLFVLLVPLCKMGLHVTIRNFQIKKDSYETLGIYLPKLHKKGICITAIHSLLQAKDIKKEDRFKRKFFQSIWKTIATLAAGYLIVFILFIYALKLLFLLVHSISP